jgi:hypothetical protein
MSPREIARRNLGLAFDVIRQALFDERVSAQLGSFGAEGPLLLVDPSDPEVALENDATLAAMRDSGVPVVGVEVERRFFLQPR